MADAAPAGRAAATRSEARRDDDDPRIADALARLPDYLGGHVLVSVTALVLGLAISLPLALVVDAPARACGSVLLGVGQRRADHPGPGAAGAVLSAAAGARGADASACSARASRRSASCRRCWR